MMKKMVCFILAACMTFCGAVSFADEVTASISYNAAKGEIVVFGKGTGNVTIAVMPDGCDPSQLSTLHLPTLYTQTEATDGLYTVTVGMPRSAEGGKYNVYVKSYDGEASDCFVYMNTEKASELIALINGADGVAFNKLIEDNALTLGIDISDSIYTAEKESIFALLDKLRFDDAAAFNTAYCKMYALCAIEGADALQAELYLEKYASQLSIDFVNDFTSDIRLGRDGRNELLRLLSAIDYINEAGQDGDVDFASLFSSMKVQAAINTADSWMTLKRVVCEDFAKEHEYLLENKKYKKIRDKDSVFEAMIKDDLADATKVSKSFENAVNNVYDSENPPTKGGSSGGSAFGSAITAPVPQPEPDYTPPETKPLFSDLSQSHWSYEAVTSLAASGIISGYGDGTFLPDKEVSRAEFTKLAISLTEGMTSDAGYPEFDDVLDSEWFAPIIKEAASLGIVKGSNGLFRPLAPVTRQDAAVIIYRIVNTTGKSTVFADSDDISSYAKEAVSSLAGEGIISGVGGNLFKPADSITRAQAAQLIYNALKRQRG